MLNASDSAQIRICAFVVSLCSFVLFIFADFSLDCDDVSNDSNLSTLTNWVALGTLGVAWSGPLTLLAGTFQFRTFKLWQPFEGGFIFVGMQAFGWALYGLVVMFDLIMLTNISSIKQYEGSLMATGIMALFAQVLLNLSIDMFQEDCHCQSASVIIPASNQHLLWNGKAIVSILLSITGQLLFFLCDLWHEFIPVPTALRIASATFMLSAVITHVLNGSLELPGYSLWQPFEGNVSFLLLQCFGWKLFALMLLGVFFITTSTALLEIRCLITACGSLGLVSQILLLLSLQYFQREDASLRRSLIRKQSGDIGETYLTTILSVVASGICTAVYFHESFPFALPENALMVVAFFLFTIATPCAHVGGLRAIQGYSWWQPFLGGTKFVCVQAFGWFLYGLFIVFGIMYSLNDGISPHIIMLIGLSGFLSQGSIALSLNYFQPVCNERLNKGNEWRWSGEIIVSVLCSLISLTIYITVDGLRRRPFFPSVLLLLMSLGFSCIATFLVHYAGVRAHSTYKLWQPFCGGQSFVIRQAMAWTFFSISVLFQLILIASPISRIPINGVISCLGAAACFPQWVLLNALGTYEAPSTTFTSQEIQAAMKDMSDTEIQHIFQDAQVIQTFLQNEVTLRSTFVEDILQNILVQLNQGNATRKSSAFTISVYPFVNIVLTMGSFVIFVASEAFRRSHPSASEVLFIVGALASIVGIFGAHCICGRKVHKSYKLFQPFRGGLKFIVFQAVGWALFACACICAVWAIFLRIFYIQMDGAIASLGFLFISAQFSLLHSLYFFDPTATSTEITTTPIHLDKKTSVNHYSWKERIISVFISMGSMLLFLIVDMVIIRFGPTFPVFPILVCAVIALFSSIPITYYLSRKSPEGNTEGASSRVIHPFGKHTMMQILGYTMWSFTVLLGVLYCYGIWCREFGLSAVIPTGRPRYQGTWMGACGLAAQLLVLFSLESPRSTFSDQFSKKPTLLQRFLLSLSINVSFTSVRKSICISAIGLAACIFQSHLHSTYTNHLGLFLLLLTCFVGFTFFKKKTNLDVALCSASSYTATTQCTTLLETLPQETIPLLYDYLDVKALFQLASSSKYYSVQFPTEFWKTKLLVGHSFLKSIENPWNLQPPPSQPVIFSQTMVNWLESIVLDSAVGLQVNWTMVHQAFRNLLTTPKFRKRGQRGGHCESERQLWKFACLSKERGNEVYYCCFCGELEIPKENMKVWEKHRKSPVHFCSSWVQICHCHRMAHRSCVENSFLHRRYLSVNESLHFRFAPLVQCSSCKAIQHLAIRLPKDWNELYRATLADNGTKTFLRGLVLKWTVFMYIFQQLGWNSKMLLFWLFNTVVLLQIFNTDRYDRSLMAIWMERRTVNGVFHVYLRLYYYFTFSSLFFLVTYSPLQKYIPLLSSISFTLDFFALVNAVAYLLVGAITSFIFWKTNYRIVTCTDTRHSSAFLHANRMMMTNNNNNNNIVPPITTTTLSEGDQDTQCALCMLHLCLENSHPQEE